MASSTDLVINVLADTSGAQININALVDSLGKLGKPLAIAGIGAVGAEMTKASMDIQDAMARVQVAVNSPDFAPGKQRYEDMKNYIAGLSTSLATSYSDIATVVAQGERYITESGQHLTQQQLDDYVQTTIRGSKISSDNIAPEQFGRNLDVITKLFPGRDTDFKQIGSEIAMAAQQHNQGEQTLLDAVIGIGQVGGDIGVTPEQAIVIGNLLSDLQMGGAFGGQVIGRAFQKMTAAADAALDPEESYAQEKKQRQAEEKVDDLNSQLAIAEQKHSEMYDSRGRLKRQYLRHPSEMMAEDAHIANLKRELADQQADMAHEGGDKATRGQANLTEMASLLGEDKTTFAQEFRDNPADAFMRWEHALSQLPENQRMSAIRKAMGASTGSTNSRDVKVFEALANPDRQASLERSAQSVANTTPEDLTNLSGIPLGTTSAHLTDAGQAVHVAAAASGDPLREGLDKILPTVTDEAIKSMQSMSEAEQAITTAFDQSAIGQKVKDLADSFGSLNPLVQQSAIAFGGLVGTELIKTLLSGAKGGSGQAVSPNGTVIPNPGGGATPGQSIPPGTPVTAGNFLGAAAIVAGGIGATELGANLGRNVPQIGPNVNDTPVAFDIGGVHINLTHLATTPIPELAAQAAQQAAQQVYDGIIAAHAQSTSTPSKQLGGSGPY